ncbi:TRAP transporter small permease subunit [Rhizobium halophytocola]|uniref:TRAP transporter small permease protein n=1 Tax=Rhizobium halophytocola TaxID=735519 RepID=A0ABS4E6F0_9HYPH|nr:TRAP transporter small permease subunit [Rhizobium halophytocola]MBP1853518.1 TRAP-type mannitol/chloroaromatic compound transport system permease small subunit [Rhizobium halophytocola]
MMAFIRFADSLSAWFGKSFAWLILLMTLGTSYEVFVRYVLGSPTPWALDLSFIMYGTLFMMGGAYTLSRDGHVRGDFLYRLWPARVQAAVDLVLYLIFFFPGVTALVFTGWKYAIRSWSYLEVSANSPAGIPIFQFKTVIVAAGLLLFVQGLAQVCRCLLCLRSGSWLTAEDDVEETETLLMRQHQVQGQTPVSTGEHRP